MAKDHTQRLDSGPWGDAIASVALLTYSLAVAAGFSRVFSGWEFFDNLAVIAIVGHGGAYVLRVTRTPIWAAFPLTALVLVWLVGAMFYRETYSLLLPTPDTWSLFRLDLDVIGRQFPTAVAPVKFLAGWNVVAAAGVAAAVLLADTFAFRAFARAEALVPGGVLFVFVAALGTDRGRIASTMLLVGTGVVATIVLRQHHAPVRSATIGSARPNLSGRMLPVALGSALAIALIAGFVGPRLPGANAEPIYETKGGNGGSVTEVVSPLVDIRSRLTNRSTTELFTVRADIDSYWRSSALASFDGRVWGIPSRGLTRTNSSIGEAAPGSIQIRQEIVINNLGGPLLPAAADPTNANGVGDIQDDLRWNADSATLVKTGSDLERGDTFLVESASPRFTAAQLAASSSDNSGDPIYLELPADFPSSVRETTLGVVGDMTNTYEIAFTLQHWMRDNFEYSLEIQEGHGNNEIESFLRNRVGYCEQFAGTYAAMLRTIGIPSRVSVGFTPGENDGSGTYSVLGRNAHAWPEVWFDDYGWVPFEPTPGRGAPFAENYTDVPQEQEQPPAGGDTSDEGAVPGSTPPSTVVTPTTIVDPGTPAVSTIPGIPAAPATTTPPVDSEPVAAAVSANVSIPWRQLGLLLLIGLTIAMPVIVRRVRRSLAGAPRTQLAGLWDRATVAMEEMGLESAAGLTPLEVADATSSVFAVAARPMQSLAEVVTEVNYAADGEDKLNKIGSYGTTTLESCASWCRQVERAVTDSLTPTAKIRRYFTVLR